MYINNIQKAYIMFKNTMYLDKMATLHKRIANDNANDKSFR